jgi:cell pole-organizing protein PopZ
MMAGYDDERQTEDMTMEDILASIRRYVSDENKKNDCPEEENTKIEFDTLGKDEDVIELSSDSLIENHAEVVDLSKREVVSKETEVPLTYSEKSTISREVVDQEPMEPRQRREGRPFEKLTEALKMYGKPKEDTSCKRRIISIEEFLISVIRPVIEEWIERNMPKIVEESIEKEIQKMKE